MHDMWDRDPMQAIAMAFGYSVLFTAFVFVIAGLVEVARMASR